MKRSKVAAASTLAFTLAIGGLLWGELQSAQAEEASATEARQLPAKKLFSFGMPGDWREKLANFLQLEESELQEKLRDSSVAEIAEAQGVARDEIKQQIVDWIREGAGDAADAMLDAKGGFITGERGFMRGGAAALHLDAVAPLLGVTADELRESLRTGKTIQELAAEQGVDIQTLVDAQVAAATAKLDDQLAAGELTQEQYDSLQAALAERIASMMEHSFPADGFVRREAGGEAFGNLERRGFVRQGVPSGASGRLPSEPAAPASEPTAD